MNDIEVREVKPGEWLIKRQEQIFANIVKKSRQQVIYSPDNLRRKIHARAPWRHARRKEWNCRIGAIRLKRTALETETIERFYVFGRPELVGGVFRTLDDAIKALAPFAPPRLGHWGEFGYRRG